MMRRRSTRGSALLGVLLLAFLTACGGSGSSGAADRPGITASPTRERPTATREPDTPGGSSEAGPTRGPTRGPTSEPAPEPTSAPATREPPRSSAPVSSSTESTAPSGSTTGDAEWPAGKEGWTVVLVTAPSEDDAKSKAEDFAGQGIEGVGVLDTNDFSSLKDGSFVVFAGQFDTQAQAADALDKVDAQDAYIRHIVPN